MLEHEKRSRESLNNADTHGWTCADREGDGIESCCGFGVEGRKDRLYLICVGKACIYAIRDVTLII